MTIRMLSWISRVLFGCVFILAGFTKAIDPLGSACKFEDYFLSLGMEGLFPLALPLAIILNSLELLVGFTILLGLKTRNAVRDDIDFIVLTSNSFETIDEFRSAHQLPFTFYQSNERELKTIIRSNPGLLLLRNGVVVDKWHYWNIPSYHDIRAEYFPD